MKNVARACIFGSVVSVTVVAMIAGCQDGKFIGPWPLAPSGGSIEDAASSGNGNGGVILSGQTTDGGTPSPSEAGEGGGSSDAGDGAAVVLPYPSVTIAAGIAFGCHIDGAGIVSCWGDNTFGQAGSTPSNTGPVALQPVPVVTNATAIAVGDYHACAVTSANEVYCWGLNNSFQLGHSPTQASGDVSCPGAGNQPVPCNATPLVVSVPPAVAIAAAGAWTCTVGTDGNVTCWGAVQSGDSDGGDGCGVGTVATGGTCSAPYSVSGISGVTQLAVAFDHACALVQGGATSCWGSNSEEQVSHGYCPDFDCAPVVQPLLPAATSVAVGTGFTCALVTDGGTVSCFGDNAYGELGHTPGTLGDPTPDAGGALYNYDPQTVGGLGQVNELVASGSYSACAIVGAGGVECWGNVASDAGAGTPVTIALPAMSALGVPDDTYACGVAATGSIWCWDLASGAAPIQVQ